MPIYWRPELFLIGIKKLDDQHQSLFDTLKQLHESFHVEDRNNELIKTFRFLKDYAVNHFQTEQELMEKYHYPGLAEQIGEHEIFIKDLNKMEQLFREEGATTKLFIKLHTKLNTWLVDHISGTDKIMGDFIKQQIDNQR